MLLLTTKKKAFNNDDVVYIKYACAMFSSGISISSMLVWTRNRYKNGSVNAKLTMRFHFEMRFLASFIKKKLQCECVLAGPLKFNNSEDI